MNSHGNLRDFFSDCEWGSIPEDRLATFICKPTPCGGLLGGNPGPPGKPSKLAALAAQRKAAAEKKASGEQSQSNASVALLSKLSAKASKPPTPSSSQSTQEESPVANPEAQVSSTSASSPAPTPVPATTSENLQSTSPPAQTTDILPQISSPPPQEQGKSIAENIPPVSQPFSVFLPAPAIHAQPSHFASSLFGQGMGNDQSDFYANNVNIYVAAANSKIENAFVGPSPDDVVKTAQASSQTKGKLKLDHFRAPFNTTRVLKYGLRLKAINYHRRCPSTEY